jgi:hypothetical protein
MMNEPLAGAQDQRLCGASHAAEMHGQRIMSKAASLSQRGHSTHVTASMASEQSALDERVLAAGPARDKKARCCPCGRAFCFTVLPAAQSGCRTLAEGDW